MHLQDPHHLRLRQYRDGSRLAARQRLHQKFSTARIPWHRFVFQALRLPPEARILEVGCGQGALWASNLPLIPSSWRLTLTDLTEGMVAEARTALGKLADRVTLLAADARRLPFKDGAFDAVVANHMLYHDPDRPAALSEFHRVLAPRGLLLAATNGPAHLHELRELLRSCGAADREVPDSAFDLETGTRQLAPWFTRVSVRRQAGGLAVIDPEAVCDYLRSLPGRRLTRGQEERVRRSVADAIARHGCWWVTADAGIFRGRRRARALVPGGG